MGFVVVLSASKRRARLLAGAVALTEGADGAAAWTTTDAAACTLSGALAVSTARCQRTATGDAERLATTIHAAGAALRRSEAALERAVAGSAGRVAAR